MFIIERGAVQITRLDPDDPEQMRQIRLVKLTPYKMFGELALLNNSIRTASAYAIGKVRCMAIRKQTVEQLITDGIIKDILTSQKNSRSIKALEKEYVMHLCFRACSI